MLKMDKVIEKISQNINIFNSFTEVYIFGSSLNNYINSNDIDLLLVYNVYSKEIVDEKNTICSFLEEQFKLPIDLTLLSENELKQTAFLEKIKFKYKRLK